LYINYSGHLSEDVESYPQKTNMAKLPLEKIFFVRSVV